MTKTDNKALVARASTRIKAPITKVWAALVEPALIKQYMYGTNVVTDWKEGSPIVWQGEWQGQAYEDKGTLVKIEPNRILQYTHFSPLSGQADVPENYHTVTIELSDEGQPTTVTLTQDNNETEEARQHSEKNWQMMLESLKTLLER
ncbi:MAG TPA: SRPBCC domain-containing protein [Anaerolineae bacterium]|nr:SRPBCC domain-containing protein [Anaerolineae bacterium]